MSTTKKNIDALIIPLDDLSSKEREALKLVGNKDTIKFLKENLKLLLHDLGNILEKRQHG